MQNEKNEPTPPPYVDESEEQALLKAISENPETAHALAAIAGGADREEVLRDLLPEKDAEEEAEEKPAPQGTESEGVPVGSPSFLCGNGRDFWDDEIFK